VRPPSVLALALVVAACGVVSADTRLADPPLPLAGTRCVNVAARVGLDFRGDYGTVFDGDPIEVAMQRNLGNGAAVGDYDGDGDLDVYLLGQGGHPSRLFRNELNGGAPSAARFTDVTEAAGLGSNRGMSRAALFADLDGDGRLDLVVANDYVAGKPGVPSAVYRNAGGGRFEDVTAGSGFAPEGYIVGGLALVDEAGRGLPSIYVSYWTSDLGGDPSQPSRAASRYPGHNRFYRNLGGFRFEEDRRAAGIGELRNDSFQAIFTDFDGDRRPDLYLAVDHRPDRYFRNVDGVFVHASREAGVGNVGNDMGIAAGDIDADGRIDLYVTNIRDRDENFGTRPPGNTLLMGDGAPGAMHVTNRAWEQRVHEGGWGWGAAFVDLDLDGVLDIYTVQGFDEFVADLSPTLRDHTARLFRGDGAGGFTPDPDSGCEVPGDQRALIPFDYDRDGDPDLLITQVGLPTLLLENRTAGQHWLTVVLDPTATAASGSWVTVRTGGRVQRHLVLASSSYLSGMPLEAYVGLGDAAVVDEMTVEWPDGRRVVLRDVPADQILRLR